MSCLHMLHGCRTILKVAARVMYVTRHAFSRGETLSNCVGNFYACQTCTLKKSAKGLFLMQLYWLVPQYALRACNKCHLLRIFLPLLPIYCRMHFARISYNARSKICFLTRPPPPPIHVVCSLLKIYLMSANGLRSRLFSLLSYILGPI